MKGSSNMRFKHMARCSKGQRSKVTNGHTWSSGVTKCKKQVIFNIS